MPKTFKKTFLQMLGPGLLYAGAAVGVSHLVQSTKAGAGFGFDLLWVLIIANILKYPFFEFGPRYAISTGSSLVEGYYRIGKWAIILFSLLTIATMFAIQAAVTIVTAGLVANIFGIGIDITFLCAIILLVTTIVLIIGKYNALDLIIKVIISLLAVSTIIAVAFALEIDVITRPEAMVDFNWGNKLHIAFLIAFVGWMPAPIDVSVWHSLWSIAKRKQLRQMPSLGMALADFKIGYIGTAFLAMGFLSLGALVMHGTGEQLSPSGSIFAGQLIEMYTLPLGKWAYWVIAIAALTTMFSTTLSVLDAYPRVLKRTTEMLVPVLRDSKRENQWLTWFWLIILVTGAIILLGALSNTMGFMVDLATTISFVTAPFFAIMNYKVVTDKHMPAFGRPKNWLKIYAQIGIVFLCLFTMAYIIFEVGNFF